MTHNQKVVSLNPAPDTRWTIVLNLYCLFEKTENKWKRGREWTISKMFPNVNNQTLFTDRENPKIFPFFSFRETHRDTFCIRICIGKIFSVLNFYIHHYYYVCSFTLLTPFRMKHFLNSRTWFWTFQELFLNSASSLQNDDRFFE